MSSRRFRPKHLPFDLDPWSYLRLVDEQPKPIAPTYGQLVDKLYHSATRTANLVEFTPDQADGLKAIHRDVLDHVLALASWVEKQDELPSLDAVASQLASYAKQAKDFEYQYSYDARDIGDFIQYHARRYCSQLAHLHRFAADARKLVFKTTTTCRVLIELELAVPATPGKVEEHLKEHGCKLYFGTDKPSRILSIKPAPQRVPKKIKKVKRRKKPQ